MKKLSWQLVIPLTVISFAVFTKWWYAYPADAPDTMFTGFPLPFAGDAWHTSMALQIFLLELLFDISVYFLFWFLLVYLVNRYLLPLRIKRGLAMVLLDITALIIVYLLLIAGNRDNVFYAKRDFDMNVKKTGYKFIWQHQDRPQ